MNTKVTAQMLKEDTPDAVILATGAVSLENRLEGVAKSSD